MDYESYIIQTEPENKGRRSYNWKTAIGLQQVDGLAASQYLIDTANSNIAGDISLGEVGRRINEYYEIKPASTDDEKRTEEADKVSFRITELLSADSFTLSPTHLASIHRHLFNGIYKDAGNFRDYNISKKEWVLNDVSVFYSDFRDIRATYEYDFEREKSFNYDGLDAKGAVSRIVRFISGLWQIHGFGEGNTRTIAVFTIKYLRSFGFDVDNDTFEKNSWYFRNALVRANYSSRKFNIQSTSLFLDRFFDNLLFEGKHTLLNREQRVEP